MADRGAWSACFTMMQWLARLKRGFQHIDGLLVGDWLTIALCLGLILLYWPEASLGQAKKCQIRQGGQVIGVYDLDQRRRISVKGPLGVSVVQIQQGKVRFSQAPCHNQYCLQQGWLSHAGEVALCLPNQVSIILLGERGFDSLAY